MNPDSPSDIRLLLEEQGLALKKRWGQNFLVNRGARGRLLDILDPGAGELVWEIGPGLGSMTELLMGRSRRLIAFEIDRGLCRYLTKELLGTGGFELVPGDFMDTWRNAFEEWGPPQAILGNLPYRSASLMIGALVESGMRPRAMVFTVQKELAERMTAVPATKSYSSFSVLCQASFHTIPRGDLRPGSFYPAPDIISSIIEMRPRQDAPDGPVQEMLSCLTRAFFASRRKTLRNNALAGRFPPPVSPANALEALEAEGIEASGRAEELPPEAFVGIARRLCSTLPSSP